MADASLNGSGVGVERREAFDEHLEWLAQQKRDFEEYQAAHNNNLNNGGSQLNDAFPVGSGSEYGYDEMPVYRSLNLMAEDEQALGVMNEEPLYRSLSMALAGASVDDEQPVYRGMDLSAMAVSNTANNGTPPPMDAHTAWAASGRPPMLRRQNAFRVSSSSEDSSWMGLFNNNSTETGM